MDYNDWKMPFNIALALHVIVFLGAVYGPGLMRTKPLYPDIYTVDLINIAEPLQSSAPAPTKPSASENAVSIAQKTPQIDVKPISIKPLKKKKVKNDVADDLAAKQRELERIRQQALLEAEEAEKRAAEAAEIAADEALNQLKDMLRETNVAANMQTPSRTTGNSSRLPRRSTSVVEGQYYASVIGALEPHWKFPGHMAWNPNLSATIIIHIANNGNVTRSYFESRSGDRIFDQFVEKALKEGSPLPPIPAALNRKELEIGLKFTVNSIQ